MSDRALFDEVVAHSGLALMIGPGVVQRALSTIGTTPGEASRDHYRRILPELKARMAIYLRGDELTAHVRDLEQLLASAA